jgi:hypothetical protein
MIGIPVGRTEKAPMRPFAMVMYIRSGENCIKRFFFFAEHKIFFIRFYALQV